MARTRAAALLAGLAADALLADPPRWHPVAGYGRLAARTRTLAYRPKRSRGALCWLALVPPVAVAAARLDRRLPRPARAGYQAALAWVVLGGAGLHRHAAEIEVALRAGDLSEARRLLPALCGRDPARLDAPGLARAVVESVAENTSDAAVAPLLWGALAGPAGLAGYRAVNTLDSMFGHRSPELLRFGWASARADDAANLLPARFTAALATLAAPLVGGRPEDAWRAWRRDGTRHPSPNAGPCEAAFAGALGLRLGGPTWYTHGCSPRPFLGDGREPVPADIGRAVRLSSAVTAAAALLTAVLGAAR